MVSKSPVIGGGRYHPALPGEILEFHRQGKLDVMDRDKRGKGGGE